MEIFDLPTCFCCVRVPSISPFAYSFCPSWDGDFFFTILAHTRLNEFTGPMSGLQHHAHVPSGEWLGALHAWTPVVGLFIRNVLLYFNVGSLWVTSQHLDAARIFNCSRHAVYAFFVSARMQDSHAETSVVREFVRENGLAWTYLYMHNVHLKSIFEGCQCFLELY